MRSGQALYGSGGWGLATEARAPGIGAAGLAYHFQMRNVLTYASPPPADRVDVVWQGDELHITVPARPTPRAIAAMTMLVAAALFAWMTAIRESLVLLGGGEA